MALWKKIKGRRQHKHFRVLTTRIFLRRKSVKSNYSTLPVQSVSSLIKHSNIEVIYIGDMFWLIVVAFSFHDICRNCI